MKKHTKLLFAFSIFLFLSCLGFYTYHWYKYPEPIDKNFLLKYYSKDLILKTGGHLIKPNDRLQHFLNFSLLKEDNVIRIGTFGDSHTYGIDVDKKETFPHQLQKLFDKQSVNKKIEILNFGVTGNGFQEQFFLWEKYHKIYDLDYILFGPRGFYPNRDTTFRIYWGSKYFKYPKDRFVLSKVNNLKLLHIKGDTLKERYKNYYKLIPSIKVLRYDKTPFKILERLFPFLRYKIQNPFYYKKISDEEESVKINIFLLEKVRNLFNKRILFLTDHGSDAFNAYQSVKRLFNLNSIQFKKSWFYETFWLHKSSIGNEIISNIYFNALIGRTDFSLKIINCYFEKGVPVNKELDKSLSLSSVKSIKIIGGENKVISSLESIVKSTPLTLHTKQHESFISLFNKSNFSGTPFIPVSVQLKKGMRIYIRNKHKNRIELGTITPLDSYQKFFAFYNNYIKNTNSPFYSNSYKTFFLLESFPVSLKKTIKKINSPLELFVENYRLGILQPYNLYGKNSLKLSLNKYPLLMAGPYHRVREKDLPDKFPLYIQYNINEQKKFKSLIPDWKCKKEKKHFHLNLPNFEPIKLK